eukprot:7140524-Pyramimonas_sp.AAC.1
MQPGGDGMGGACARSAGCFFSKQKQAHQARFRSNASADPADNRYRNAETPAGVSIPCASSS